MKRCATAAPATPLRSALLVPALALGLAAGLSAPAQAQRNGTYDVNGTNPDGSPYSGTLTIQQVGLSSWRVRWQLGQAQVDGYGMSMGTIFSVGFVLGDRPGMSIYEVAPDGGMSGQWTLVGSSAIGSENLTPR